MVAVWSSRGVLHYAARRAPGVNWARTELQTGNRIGKLPGKRRQPRLEIAVGGEFWLLVRRETAQY